MSAISGSNENTVSVGGGPGGLICQAGVGSATPNISHLLFFLASACRGASESTPIRGSRTPSKETSVRTPATTPPTSTSRALSALVDAPIERDASRPVAPTT